MQDTTTVKLPVSGKDVVIRNYTTRADDENAETILYKDVNSEREMNSDNAKLVFPLANVMASQRSYIPRLVQSIGGDNSNIAVQIDNLRSADYEALEAAVSLIVNDNSPKATEASDASKNATTTK